ncbi:telomere-associated recQ-like helicase [Fusarium pseudocircinatum]|uniref:Telomere-associated recQ-like helicase n=1 Tax=Fusarium pseudocircinatum TaxID=56676 RepID=A0A8H5KQ58_9HYPO|nr:telomere-associated recQ-like helicase [Fusarium pseudocircinatum]
MADERDRSAALDVEVTPRAAASTSSVPDNILECHQRLESDIAGPYFVSLELEPRIFESIRPQLNDLFRRFDYDADAGIVTLRMPSKIHDDFATEFGLVLQKVIDDILRAVPNAPRITNRQSRLVKLWEHDKAKKRLECYPDGQFKDDRASKPGLIYEVGYSQTGESLEKVAKDYIVGTKGAITTAFQDSNGRMVNGDKLVKLRLTDMAKEKYSDDYPLAPIHIPFTQLSQILDFAKAQPEGSSP